MTDGWKDNTALVKISYVYRAPKDVYRKLCVDKHKFVLCVLRMLDFAVIVVTAQEFWNPKKIAHFSFKETSDKRTGRSSPSGLVFVQFIDVYLNYYI